MNPDEPIDWSTKLPCLRCHTKSHCTGTRPQGPQQITYPRAGLMIVEQDVLRFYKCPACGLVFNDLMPELHQVFSKRLAKHQWSRSGPSKPQKHPPY